MTASGLRMQTELLSRQSATTARPAQERRATRTSMIGIQPFMNQHKPVKQTTEPMLIIIIIPVAAPAIIVIPSPWRRKHSIPVYNRQMHNVRGQKDQYAIYLGVRCILSRLQSNFAKNHELSSQRSELRRWKFRKSICVRFWAELESWHCGSQTSIQPLSQATTARISAPVQLHMVVII